MRKQTPQTPQVNTSEGGEYCGGVGDDRGGHERVYATPFKDPGVWWRSLVNSEM